MVHNFISGGITMVFLKVLKRSGRHTASLSLLLGNIIINKDGNYSVH